MFKLSSEASLDGAITVENKFIVEYLPYADGDYVKVYLYGLSLAARKSDPDDSLERLSRRLDLDISTVNAAIDYWTELGLMSRLGGDITYLSLKTVRPKIKKFDVDKFAEFNRQSQIYISERQITPNEFNEYYALMERLNLEWQAMVLIVKYCVDLKGGNVSCAYILAVARNLAQDGYRTYDEVANRLEEYGVYYNDLTAVLAVMGGKRPDHETVKLYKKWKMSYKYDRETILHVAESVKKGGAAMLDARLTLYHDLGLTTAAQIDGYETDRREMYKLAKSVNKALGIYYENVDPEIASYIRPYLDMGFEPQAIIHIADYCMKNGLKTLSDLDAVMREFFAAGILTEADVKSRVDNESKFDADIAEVMRSLGIMGAVKQAYRAFYSNWVEGKKMPKDVIMYAASLSSGKTFAYVNAIITAWANAGVNTVDAAKTTGIRAEEQKSDATVTERISADELNKLFSETGE